MRSRSLPSIAGNSTLTTPNQASGNDALDSDVNVTTGASANFTLAAGEHNSTLDIGYVSPKGVIGDLVWKDLDRDGQQDPGEPGIEGITVTLYDSTGVPVGTTTTDASGHYAFTDLPPGTYTIGFPTTLPGGLVLDTPDQGSDTTDSDPSVLTGRTTPITLAPGEHITSIDAGFNSPLASIGDFVFEDTNRNGQQDAGEPGIENVQVTLFEQQRRGPSAPCSLIRPGHYAFADLQPGTYKLQFPTSLNGGLSVLTTADTGADATDSDPSKTTGITADITLVAGQNDNTKDAGYVHPKASIGDFVFADLNRDGIQQPNEPGIANVPVKLIDSAGHVVGSTITDGTGAYSFLGLNPGTYIVEFPPTLPNGDVLATPDQGANDNIDSDPNKTNGKTTPITVFEGQQVTNVDAGLHQSARRHR